MSKLRVDYDAQADAAYVYLTVAPHAYTEEMDSRRIVDRAEDGSAIGVEFLYASKGIDLHDLPNAGQIEKALHESGHKLRILTA